MTAPRRIGYPVTMSASSGGPDGVGERHHRSGVFVSHLQGASRRLPRRHHYRSSLTSQTRSKRRIVEMGTDKVDVVITEVGGRTVGDIESLPFLEAVRQVRQDLGRATTSSSCVSLLPYIGPSGELKTKPTQHSVAALRSIGINPMRCTSAPIARCRRTSSGRSPRACDVDAGPWFARWTQPASTTSQGAALGGLDAYVVRRLDLPFRDVNWSRWDDLLRRVHAPAHEINLALVGRVRRPAGCLPVRSPRRCAPGVANDCRVRLHWVASDDCATEGRRRRRPWGR